ncbi:MAG: GHKL domain-containing protein [Deltaproteobacteria bacterium]|jgi:two-component system phosphate regulon sensor histidine kinase PhoR|nr:GHKL domain-containing protein [Deltaproteobacteria bacterium]
MMGHLKVFVLVFLPAAVSLIFGLALIQQKNQQLSGLQFQEQLKNQWLLVSIILKKEIDDNFSDLSRKLGLRITVIDDQGKVSIDTSADPQELEDHSQREEVKKAFLGVPAMAMRVSASTGIHTIYYAEKIDSNHVLRVAYPADYYRVMGDALMTQTFSGLLILMICLAVFAVIVSRNARRTLASLSRAVTEAQNGSSELPSFNNDSLDAALYSLSTVTRELRESDQQMSKLNSRLQYILDNVNEGVLLFQQDQILYHNVRAEQILNCQIPRNLAQVNQPQLITAFEVLSNKDGAASLQIYGKTIAINRYSSGETELVILYDVSDREKYSGYKSDLIGNLSHELKTPLSLILTTCELVVSDPQMERKTLDKFLGTVLRNADRINELLDDLIYLHRLESSAPTDSEQCDIYEVVSDVKELVDCQGKNVIWRCDGVNAEIDASARADAKIAINPSHILSVLTNLITNAAKYSSGQNIEVSVQIKDDLLEISVSDEGPAIPPAEKERVFERFYSLSKSRNRQETGSGLGLSIVKHIAKLYQGQAWAADNSKNGNTFSVRLIGKKRD